MTKGSLTEATDTHHTPEKKWLSFFCTLENSEIMKLFTTLKSLPFFEHDKQMNERFDRAKRIVNIINSNPENWDQWVPYNILNLGKGFIAQLKSFSELHQGKGIGAALDQSGTEGSRKKALSEDLDYIYSGCYRFICEYDFFQRDGSNENVHSELLDLKKVIESEYLDVERHLQGLLAHSVIFIPTQLIKFYLQHENILAIKRYNENTRIASKLNDNWTKEIEAKEKVVAELKEQLEDVSHGYNFVGLHKGFARITENKEEERLVLTFAMVVMAFIIIVPLFFEIWVLFSNPDTQFKIDSFFKLFPLVTLEIVLIYFFRILLVNYRSVKAQILQLELRKTLCEFIQKYVDYSKEIKTKEDNPLEKFENLIFSGLVSDSEKIPSTFDGIDQLTQLAKAVTGK